MYNHSLANLPYCNMVDNLEICKYHNLLVLEPIPLCKTYFYQTFVSHLDQKHSNVR